MNKTLDIVSAICGCVVLAGCLVMMGCDNDPGTTDQQVAAQQEQSLEQGNQQVGMPGITNFTEKRLLKDIYERRDKEVSTFAYLVDYQGRLHHLCDSVGYGLPYSTQYSNPQVQVYNLSTYATIPQAEPNGLFMPSDAEGTWVECADPNGGKPTPVYVEPRVIVSPFKLNAVDDYAAKQ